VDRLPWAGELGEVENTAPAFTGILAQRGGVREISERRADAASHALDPQGGGRSTEAGDRMALPSAPARRDARGR